MRWTAILVAGCVTPLVGCRLAQTAAHNLVNEPVEYFDERKVTKRVREEAEDVLKELCGRRGRVFADDFKDGFVDGYADFLERGGNTAPPAVPPLKYRRGRFLNPDGHARIHDYFAGFKMGMDTAAQTGKRQFYTVPVLVPDPLPDPTVNARQIPADQCAPAAVVPPPRPEQLPVPRVMDPATGLAPPNRPPADPIPAAPVVPPIPDPAGQPRVPPVKSDPPKASDVSSPLPAIPLVAGGQADVRPIAVERPGADDPVPQRTVVPPLPETPRRSGVVPD
jgi:hypothetical protein